MADDENDDKPDSQAFTDPSPCLTADIDLSILCDALQERGVTSVTVRYEGSGDSGSVEEVSFLPENVNVPKWLEENLSAVAENYCPDGYENNDGGYGTLTIYPGEGFAVLEHTDRYEDAVAIDTDSALLPAEIQRQLSGQGVTRMTAHFDGYGDEGQVEEWATEPESASVYDTLINTLEEFVFDQLPEGWEINEGTYGDVTVDVQTGAVDIDAYGRIAKESDSHLTHWNWRASMAHPYHHALSSVKKWGGMVENYLPIHDWFDASKAFLADFRHRALRHHAEGIFWSEEVFGTTITNSDGRVVPVRWIGEQHVKEDLGWIPTLQDWFKHIRVQPWMSRSGDRQVGRGDVSSAPGESQEIEQRQPMPSPS